MVLVTVEKKERKGGGWEGVKVASNELTCECWSVGKWTWGDFNACLQHLIHYTGTR